MSHRLITNRVELPNRATKMLRTKRSLAQPGNKTFYEKNTRIEWRVTDEWLPREEHAVGSANCGAGIPDSQWLTHIPDSTLHWQQESRCLVLIHILAGR